MKCRKCGYELKNEDKFCPECGTKVKKQSEFSKKVEAENKANEHQKKMAQKELERQNKIIKEKGLKNDAVYLSFGCGLIGTLFTFWPAGHTTQIQWWYVLCTLGFGIIGYVFSMRANKKNKEYHQRYRVIVNPKLMKAGIYLSALATFGGTILLVAAIIVNMGGL